MYNIYIYIYVYKVKLLYTIYATNTCYSIIAKTCCEDTGRQWRMHRYTENDVKPDSNDDPRLVSSNAVLHPHFASSAEAFTLGVMWLKQCHKTTHLGLVSIPPIKMVMTI